MNPTFVERHFNLSVSEFEGLWSMTFMHPFNETENISVYIIAPNSNYLEDDYDRRPIIKAGPRLSEVMTKLLHKIESYPYNWDFSGQKIVQYGYDFETDYRVSGLTYIDLTHIAHQEVNEYFNFFSPLETTIVSDDDILSGRGVMIKLKIELNKPKHINRVALDLFTEFPIKLVSLMYQEEKKDGAPFYEIPMAKLMQSNNSVSLHFPTVFAKTFRLIIQQESYILESKETNMAHIEAVNLWNYATASSREMYESTVSDYLDNLTMPTQSGIELHQAVIDSYHNSNKEDTRDINDELDPYRNDFTEAKYKMDQEQR